MNNSFSNDKNSLGNLPNIHNLHIRDGINKDLEQIDDVVEYDEINQGNFQDETPLDNKISTSFDFRISRYKQKTAMDHHIPQLTMEEV